MRTAAQYCTTVQFKASFLVTLLQVYIDHSLWQQFLQDQDQSERDAEEEVKETVDFTVDVVNLLFGHESISPKVRIAVHSIEIWKDGQPSGLIEVSQLPNLGPLFLRSN